MSGRQVPLLIEPGQGVRRVVVSVSPQVAEVVVQTVEARAEALYVLPDPLLFANRIRINILALGARLPTLHALRE